MQCLSCGKLQICPLISKKDLTDYSAVRSVRAERTACALSSSLLYVLPSTSGKKKSLNTRKSIASFNRIMTHRDLPMVILLNPST